MEYQEAMEMQQTLGYAISRAISVAASWYYPCWCYNDVATA